MNAGGDHDEKLPPRPPRLALDALCKRPSDRIVLFTVAQHCDWWTGYFSPSVETLVCWTGLSRRAVQNSLSQLLREGWLLPHGTREHGIREYFLALDGPEADSKPLAAPGESPEKEPEPWQVEEVLTWAQELELGPTGADRAVIREWLERRYSRIVILGALRLGKLRKRYQRDRVPIRSLRYFDTVLPDLAAEKPDDNARIAYVKQLGLELGHRPALPPPPAVARRAYERREEVRRGLEDARARAAQELPQAHRTRSRDRDFVSAREALAELTAALSGQSGQAPGG